MVQVVNHLEGRGGEGDERVRQKLNYVGSNNCSHLLTNGAGSKQTHGCSHDAQLVITACSVCSTMEQAGPS